MARGTNQILVSSELEGRRMEGFVKAGQTFTPGIIVMRDPTVALRQGRHTYKIYDRTTGDPTGGPAYVVRQDYLRGDLVTQTYGPGERCFLYELDEGDEVNLLVKNLAGTADDHALGEMLMIDANTGKMVVSDGTKQKEVAMLQEAIVDPIADTLAWCIWRGN